MRTKQEILEEFDSIINSLGDHVDLRHLRNTWLSQVLEEVADGVPNGTQDDMNDVWFWREKFLTPSSSPSPASPEEIN